MRKEAFKNNRIELVEIMDYIFDGEIDNTEIATANDNNDNDTCEDIRKDIDFIDSL